jgi:hypothetical protein
MKLAFLQLIFIMCIGGEFDQFMAIEETKIINDHDNLLLDKLCYTADNITRPIFIRHKICVLPNNITTKKILFFTARQKSKFNNTCLRYYY